MLKLHLDVKTVLSWILPVFVAWSLSCDSKFKHIDITMLGFFSGLKDFLKFDHVWIDNNVFRLHYKATVLIFVTCSLLVSTRQYIGDPIDCMVDGVPGGIMDTYCWIHSTYSVPTRYDLWTSKLWTQCIWNFIWK